MAVIYNCQDPFTVRSESMTNPCKNDPWVLKHKEMLDGDREYSAYCKRYGRRAKAVVKNYTDMSSYVVFGFVFVILAIIAAALQIHFVQMDQDYDVIDALLGKLGSDLQMDALEKNALSLLILTPAGLLIGLFLLITSVKDYRRVVRLMYCTRMVEGYITDQDPIKMVTPKRYDPSWL